MRPMKLSPGVILDRRFLHNFLAGESFSHLPLEDRKTLDRLARDLFAIRLEILVRGSYWQVAKEIMIARYPDPVILMNQIEAYVAETLSPEEKAELADWDRLEPEEPA